MIKRVKEKYRSKAIHAIETMNFDKNLATAIYFIFGSFII